MIAFAFFACAVGAFAQNAPVVEKVEPPNWWAGHSINPVRVLVKGKNLKPGTVNEFDVKSVFEGIEIDNVLVNESGTYVFMDLAIDKSAKPGKYPIKISTANGTATIPFDIFPRRSRSGMKRGISNEDIIYLIMPDRFANGDESNDRPGGTSEFANDRKNPRTWHGGDLRGIQKNIPYLKELGVTAVWLTPWYDNPDIETNCDKPWCPNTNYHGYHAIDYYSVENRFGTMRDLQNFVAECHRNGIKVIQDQVSNHVGHTHPWMKDRPLDNWFTPYVQNSFNNSVLLSPNASPAERNNLIKGWFNEFLPDLNQAEPEVAKYVFQNTLWWIEMAGIDGIRQDTIQYMSRDFIRDWSEAILKEYPDFWMVGEIFERDSAQTAFFQGGRKGWDGIDTKLPAVFDFKLWETSQQVFTGHKPARALRDVLKYDGLYPDINNVVFLANNHDTDRFMSLKGATKEGAMLHMAFVLATRGIPQLYYGEEILMTGGHDPDNRKDFPGGWSGDPVNKFSKTGRTADEQEMLEWTKGWTAFRKSSPALMRGRTIDLVYDDEKYVFARKSGDETVILVFNNSVKSQAIRVRHSDLGLSGTDYNYSDMGVGLPEGAFAVASNKRPGPDGMVELQSAPRSATAYSVTKSPRQPGPDKVQRKVGG